jgi:RimJ/RimL family protein N-acetyltransferase
MLMLTIREIRESDAAVFLALQRLLDQETAFMLYEPDERKTTLSQQINLIRRVADLPNRTIFLALTEEGEAAGYVAGLGGLARRNSHKADVTIGVAQEFAGQGLGTRLMETVERWARNQGLHKLELTVMADNERAIALYRKMGYQDEGRQVDSLRVNGRYIDELSMGKLLTAP